VTREFEDRVIGVLHRLKRGEVVSYGEVAAAAGFPGAARAVGNLLRRGVVDVPWWRVVRADGRIVTWKGADQAARLREEGVVVRDGRVQQQQPRASGSADPSRPRPRRGAAGFSRSANSSATMATKAGAVPTVRARAKGMPSARARSATTTSKS
jgi:methylated-DNA-protein-cysteine methyltransferase-like protein